MIGLGSRGAGKYEKLPVGVWSILEMPCLTSDGTGPISFLEDWGRIVGHSLADCHPFIGHFLTNVWMLKSPDLKKIVKINKITGI